MCSQWSVSAIGVESSHLKLWCGTGSETTAAAAPCREEATYTAAGLCHTAWKTCLGCQSTLQKIVLLLDDCTLFSLKSGDIFSPSCHPSCLSYAKKKNKEGKEEWRNDMFISVFPKILILFWLDHQRRDIVYEYFEMCIVLCGLAEPRWWKCLFAQGSK